MKQEYIKAIEKQLQECNDIALLDFIYRIMDKSKARAAK